MIDKKHIWFWILGGIVVALLLIYFALSNGTLIFSIGREGSPLPGATPSGAGGASSNAPAGISYNQRDAQTAGANVVVTGAPEAPGQSAPIAELQIPKSAVKISIEKWRGFTPASFTVRAGETVVVSITSAENRSHTFVFDDASLSSVAVGVAPHETRVITFTAPKKPGNYVFRDNVFGATEQGMMVVR